MVKLQTMTLTYCNRSCPKHNRSKEIMAMTYHTIITDHALIIPHYAPQITDYTFNITDNEIDLR